MKVEGYIKQPKNGIRKALIIVNDTLNKIPQSDRSRRDEILKNQNLVTVNDDKGYFEILVKANDSLIFKFDRLFYPERHAVSDLIKRDKIIIDPKPKPCLYDKKCDQKIPSKLYIFVGKKINITSVDRSQYCDYPLDSKYDATYKIEKEFSNYYPNSIINFFAYDHSSMYEYDFRNYDNILIFVGEYCGDLIKDYFFPVYKTIDGRWATPVDTYMEPYYKSDKFIPKNINFEKSVEFNLLRSNNNPTKEQIVQLKQFKFPEKYYKIEDGKAIPIMGRYAEDLVKLWKEMSKRD